VPFGVPIGEAFKLLGSNVVVEIMSEWVSPSVSGGNLTESGVGGVNFLSSDVVLWGVWNVWAVRVLSARSSVGSTIVMPLEVSIGEAFKLLCSNIVVGVLSERIGPSVSCSDLTESGVGANVLLSSDVVLWGVWYIWGV
jgi:hypothetical protein